MNREQGFVMKKIILTSLITLVSANAYSGGYRVALQGQQALGMGHTGVAMSQSAESLFFNPGAASFLSAGEQFTGGLTLIDAETRYQNAATSTTAKTENPTGTPINLYYAVRENDKLSYGLGIYTPYGNRVEWPKDWAGSHLVNNIELAAVYIQPTVSYKVSDNLGFGIGPTLVVGAVEFNRNLSTSLVDANGNRSNVTIKASGVTALGLNLGMFYKYSNEVSLGLNYRTRVDMKARGESADFENVPVSLQAAFADTTFDADLVLPAELTLGVSFMAGDAVTIALDINRTYWSAYKSLDITFNNSVGTSVNPRNYQDANIYRLGIQYEMSEDLTLRGGVYLDKSPIQNGYFAPETPRNDATGYTGGASYRLSKNMSLDFSLLVLVFDEFTGSYDFYNQSGTNISFGGEYKSAVTTVGFGIDYVF